MDFAAALFWFTLRVVAPEPPRIAETIVVTTSHTAPIFTPPAAVTTLNREVLDFAPAATLDDTLRSVPGFSLFRRSSSRVANPTTQGVTLRGLAASGSSRALALGDGVPLNDPVGGWVYWNRLPLAWLNDVSVERGAAGDVFGTDAVGGAVVLNTNSYSGVRLLLEGGSDETGRLSGYGGRDWGSGSVFAAAEAYTTDGFVIVAPESRGPIDTPAGSRHGSAHVGVRRGTTNRLNARAGYFRESRENGTPFQENSTWVTHGSVDLYSTESRLQVRGYGQIQHYYQTFSAVLPGRATEVPTSEQDVDASALGATAEWRSSTAEFALGLAASARRVTSELTEVEYLAGLPQAPRTVEPSQATVGGSAVGIWAGPGFDIGATARADLWQSTLDDETNRHTFFSPRVWFTTSPGGFRINLAVQSGSRGPTINELYRPFRAGNTFTRANPLLKPEAVRGFEGGVSRSLHRSTVRVLGFWSRVDDAIVNVTLSSSGGVITRERQNAARIHAKGIELELETRVSPMLTLTLATAYQRSTFVDGPLEGLRVPQVPTWHHAFGGRGAIGRARWSAEYRFIDEQFDDDRNQFPLDESSMVDARVGWMLNRRLEIFGAIENLFDEEQDVGRTPIRTIGLPRTSRVGMRFVF